jgi:ribosomal protein L19
MLLRALALRRAAAPSAALPRRALSAAPAAPSALAAAAAAVPPPPPPPPQPAPASAPSSAPAPAPAAARVRFKNAFKHASGVMAEVTRDAEARMAVKHALARPALPRFRAGDAVEISYAMESGEAEPMPVRGTVLGKWKRGLDSKFTVINSQDGEWYTASYVHSSPLLRGLKLMQRARWSEGLKRSRRAKLTHLLNADPRSYIVDQSTKEASVLQAEKEARRALQRSGKQTKKLSERAISKEKEAKEAAKAAGGAAAGAAAPAAKGGAAAAGKGKAAAAAPAAAAPAKKAAAAPAKK